MAFKDKGSYKLLFERSADAMLIIEGEKFVDCNQATLDMLGIGSRKELFSTHPSQLSPEYQPDGQRSFEKANEMISIAKDQGSNRFEWIHTRANGNDFPVEVLLTHISFEGRGLLHVVWRDITERKKDQEELLKYANELKRSNQELQDFTSIASHDLREPLRKVITFGDRLKEKSKNLDKVSRDYIQRMSNATMRMQLLLDDLLSYSKIAAKPKPFEQVDLNVIIEKTMSDLEYMLTHSKGTVSVGDFTPIQADPSQIGQLFQNLIGNALKYHKAGIAPVINIYCRSSGDEKIEIAVEDNGIGFDEKYTEKIFQPFQRLHGKNEYEGTGMGLAICKKVIDRHNGAITAKSVVDEGSTFIVTLPKKQTNV